MAGKKKEKKLSYPEKKKKHKDKGLLGRIGSELVPTAIFAAVPRTPSQLGSTQPSRTPSPLVQALGEAGIVGRALVGPVSRPGSSLQGIDEKESIQISTETVESGETVKAKVVNFRYADTQDHTELTDDEDPKYELVQRLSGDYDKKIRFQFEKMGNRPPQPLPELPTDLDSQNGNTESPKPDHFYHILEDDRKQQENAEIGDPKPKEPVYAKVDKRKTFKADIGEKKTDKVQRTESNISSVSSEDLTAVSSEVSTASTRSPKRHKSRSRRSLDFDQQQSEDKILHDQTDSPSKSKHHKSKKRSQIQTHSDQDQSLSKDEDEITDRNNISKNRPITDQDETDMPGEPLPPIPKQKFSKEDIEREEIAKLELLGFDEYNRILGLDELSDGELIPPAKTPKNTIDFHGKTQFEQDMFNETLDGSMTSAMSTRYFEQGGQNDAYETPDAQMHKSLGRSGQRLSKDEIMFKNEQNELHAGENDEESPLNRSLREVNNQQKRLEMLIKQQQIMHQQQLEQQQLQEKQRKELDGQQHKLENQLLVLEQLQQERLLGGSMSRAGDTITEDATQFQRELVQQQQDLLRQQQLHQAYQQGLQEKIVKQQEKLYEQLSTLEMQHLQSHEDDSDGSSMMEYNLEEQRNQRELFNLLYQQQMDQIEHEQQYQLQLMMQQRQYDKSRFSERQKSMEEQQKELLQRIREQENQREKLEQQLSDSLKKTKGRSPSIGELERPKLRERRSTSMDSIAEIPATRSKTSRSLESELERQNRLKNSPEGLAQQGSSSKRNGSEGEPRQYELQGDAYHLIKSRADMLQSEKNALMDLNKSLQEENLTMKQMAVSLRGTGGDSLLIVQKQTKLLQGENAVLKDSVHRLNVELSRYQAKYRPVSPEEVAGSSLPSGKKAAPWLVNTKYLSPLFLAYDDRLREKDDIIKTYDEELNSFRIRINDIIKENQQLHMHQSKTDPAAFRADEWQQLQEQAKLVLEENSVLMEQQEVLEQKLKEIQKSHSVEVTKVSRKLGNMDSEKQRLELELEDERKLNAAIKKKYEKLIDDEQNKIPMKEHLQVVEEFQRVLNEFKSKSMTDSGSYLSQLEASQKEKKSMASYNADVAARNSQLERELETLRKALSRSEKRNVVLQHKLDHLTEREIAAQKTLDEVLKVAEKTAQERDQFLHLASSQRKEQEHAVTRIQQGDFVVGKLEEKLKDYKDKAGFKIARVSGKLEEKNKEMNQLKEHYEGEINNLKTLLRDKQRQLENMMGQQRHIEDELDQVWRTASADNKKMKKTVRQRNGAFDSDSDPPVNLSSDEADK